MVGVWVTQESVFTLEYKRESKESFDLGRTRSHKFSLFYIHDAQASLPNERRHQKPPETEKIRVGQVILVQCVST